jgi:hypothetical protein
MSIYLNEVHAWNFFRDFYLGENGIDVTKGE